MEKRHIIEYQGQPLIVEFITIILIAVTICFFANIILNGDNSISNFINSIEIISFFGIIFLILFLGTIIGIIFFYLIIIRKIFKKRKHIIINDVNLVIDDEIIYYKNIKDIELKKLYSVRGNIVKNIVKDGEIGYELKLKWNKGKLNMSVTTDKKYELNMLFNFYKDLEEAYNIYKKMV